MAFDGYTRAFLTRFLSDFLNVGDQGGRIGTELAVKDRWKGKHDQPTEKDEAPPQVRFGKPWILKQGS